jgi:secreted trypsin-like serine protease
LIPSEKPARYVLVDTVAESKADLAVVLLDTPVDKVFLPTSLSKTNITLHESVIVAGYGANSVEEGLVVFSDGQATRRVGKNTVARTDSEKFITESPGSLALPGDSGGPCFRKEATGLTVVGINSRSAPGKKATFTNTYQYQEWLKVEIQQAERQGLESP